MTPQPHGIPVPWFGSLLPRSSPRSCPAPRHPRHDPAHGSHPPPRAPGCLRCPEPPSSRELTPRLPTEGLGLQRVGGGKRLGVPPALPHGAPIPGCAPLSRPCSLPAPGPCRGSRGAPAVQTRSVRTAPGRGAVLGRGETPSYNMVKQSCDLSLSAVCVPNAPHPGDGVFLPPSTPTPLGLSNQPSHERLLVPPPPSVGPLGVPPLLWPCPQSPGGPMRGCPLSDTASPL